MNLNLTRTRLLVNDFASCFKFYRDVLKLSHVGGNGEGPYAEFSTGNHLLALFERKRMLEVIESPKKAKNGKGSDTFALIFEVSDVDASYNDLKRIGVEFLTTPKDRPAWGLRTAHLRDPEGNLIELYTDRPELYHE